MKARIRRDATWSLLTVLFVTLAGATVWQGWVYADHRTDVDQRREAISVAKAQVIDLTTMDSTTVKSKVAAMKRRTSGDFKRQLEGVTSTFESVVSDSDVKAHGKIAEAAVVSIDHKKATILVASTSSVTSKKNLAPATRTYRLRVTLSHNQDGWLINGMEFV